MDAAQLKDQIPALRRYARAFTGSAWAADDLVQDTLERACTKWTLWTASSNLRAWLFTIMHNIYVSDVRGSRRPDDVHAWVDGRLPEGQRATLEDQLRDQPALLADAQEWKRLNLRIGELHADVLDGPLPAHLLQAASQLGQRQQQRNQWTRWGGMAASVLFAFGMGWFLQALLSGFSPGFYASQQRSEKAFVMQASVAHAVFSPEVKHPVEVSAAEQQHLVQWLSKRLGRELKVPDLSAQGFQLMGGRLLSGDSGARAQFMVDNATGKRVTLYVGGLTNTTTGASTATSFQFSQRGKNLSFYWVDRNFGYALSGDLDRPALMALSEAVYAQLPR